MKNFFITIGLVLGLCLVACCSIETCQEDVTLYGNVLDDVASIDNAWALNDFVMFNNDGNWFGAKVVIINPYRYEYWECVSLGWLDFPYRLNVRVIKHGDIPHDVTLTFN